MNYLVSNAAKILILGVITALSIWAGVILVLHGAYIMTGLLLVGAMGINYVYFSRRAYPLRYLIPGLIFLTAFVTYPIGYTVYVSFTNLGTGHLLTKEQAISQITGRFFVPPDAPAYSYEAFRDPSGDIAVLIHVEDGDLLYFQGRLTPIHYPDDRFIDENGDGKPDRFLSYVRMTMPQIIKELPHLEDLVIPYGDRAFRLDSLTAFKLATRRYSYDAGQDAIIDLATGKVYRAVDGFFTSPDGEELYPGFKVWLGWANYVALIFNPAVAGPFGRVFLWTILFAMGSVLTTFTIGLALALLLNDPYLKLRRLYRVLVIVPYAIPAFISILIWKGLLNTNMGVINTVILNFFHLYIPWLDSPFWAKVSIIMVNLWLGYPYMLIVSLGALQSIPGELYEAALVDGANWRQRFSRITLPLLLMPLAPLLIGSFAFNFNNFTLIWLLTKGGPPIPGAQTAAGSTDILISYTYKLAFEGARGNQLGLAAAVSMIIFLIIATISAFNFRLTGALEDLSKNV